MITFTLKEKTKSLNQSFRGDWQARAGTAKRQRNKAMADCPKWMEGPLLCIRLTRVSPGKLDDDAVPAALKHVRDGVAARLRVDDASELVRWTYEQASGDAAVVVQIWKYASEAAPPKVASAPVTSQRKKAAPVEKDWRKSCGCLMGTKACEHDLLRHGQSRAQKSNIDVIGKRLALHRDARHVQRSAEAKALAVVTSDAGTTLHVARPSGSGQKRAPRPAYTPPRCAAMAATAPMEAEETFAPAPDNCRAGAPCGHCIDCIGTLP